MDHNFKSYVSDLAWPEDREAVRFVVLTRPDSRGLQKIRSLAWVDGRRRLFERTTNLNEMLGSARRRSVVFELIDLCDQHSAEAA